MRGWSGPVVVGGAPKTLPENDSNNRLLICVIFVPSTRSGQPRAGGHITLIALSCFAFHDPRGVLYSSIHSWVTVKSPTSCCGGCSSGATSARRMISAACLKMESSAGVNCMGGICAFYGIEFDKSRQECGRRNPASVSSATRSAPCAEHRWHDHAVRTRLCTVHSLCTVHIVCIARYGHRHALAGAGLRNNP